MNETRKDQINFGVSSFSRVTNEDIRKHMPLACKIAREGNFGNALNIDEKVAAGLVGVAVGIETFDPSRGNALSSWLSWNITKAILEETRLCRRQTQYREKEHQRALYENYRRKEEYMSDLDSNLRDFGEKNGFVEKAMSVLKENERRCVEGIVFESKTQRQLALENGTSQSWASRVWRESISKMRANADKLDDIR